MFVTVSTVDIAGVPIEQVPVMAQEGDRWLRETEGFEGLILLAGEGKLRGLAFWESRETAQRHQLARAQFRDRMLSLAGLRLEEMVDYDVVFARLGSGWAKARGK